MLSETPFDKFVSRGSKQALALVLGACVFSLVFVSVVPIPRSVVATGSVASLRATRSVEHDIGGIVEALPVVDGQTIKKGEALLKFETAGLEAEKLALATELVTLSAERESLLKEKSAAGEKNFSETLRNFAHAYDLEADLLQQAARASAKSEVNAELTAQLEKDLATLKQRRRSFKAQKVAKLEEFSLIQDLVKRKEPLVAEGFVAQTDLNRLKIEEASVRGAIERIHAEVKDVEGRIANVESNLIRAPQEFDFERLTRLAELTRHIADRRKRMTQVTLSIAKSAVVAPVSGQVIGLSVNTLGSYVAPSQTIAMIVPHNEEMIIDVRLNPRDIDLVTAGMTAKVVFSAFPQRKIPEISAKIESVASDVLTDPVTGNAYYQTKMRIPNGVFNGHASETDMTVLSGMPVDVFIPVNKMSVLQYIWTPVRQSFRRSFRA